MIMFICCNFCTHGNERHNFHECAYMYINYQRTENERSARNQVNIPTIAVGAHEKKTDLSTILCKYRIYMTPF